MKVKTKKILAAVSALTLVCGIVPTQPFADVINSIELTADAAATESDFDFDAKTGTIMLYNGDDEEVEIPSVIGGVAVKTIGKEAFCNCTSLKKIVIPDSVESIEELAFESCKSLSEITIPETVKYIAPNAFTDTPLKDKVTDDNSMIIKNGVLISGQGCEGNIVVPDGVTAISNNAFAGCKYLTGITIPESVTNIGLSAFADCEHLKHVSLPEGLKSIGKYAFDWCCVLESIEIPSSVTRIEEGVFSHCQQLKNVTIPDSVKTIGRNAQRVGNYNNTVKKVAESYGDNVKFADVHGCLNGMTDTTAVRLYRLCIILSAVFSKHKSNTQHNILTACKIHTLKISLIHIIRVFFFSRTAV